MFLSPINVSFPFFSLPPLPLKRNKIFNKNIITGPLDLYTLFPGNMLLRSSKVLILSSSTGQVGSMYPLHPFSIRGMVGDYI